MGCFRCEGGVGWGGGGGGGGLWLLVVQSFRVEGVP